MLTSFGTQANKYMQGLSSTHVASFKMKFAEVKNNYLDVSIVANYPYASIFSNYAEVRISINYVSPSPTPTHTHTWREDQPVFTFLPTIMVGCHSVVFLSIFSPFGVVYRGGIGREYLASHFLVLRPPCHVTGSKVMHYVLLKCLIYCNQGKHK